MQPYLPSNGSEGMIFEAMWCDRCSRRAIDPCAKHQCVHELRALAGVDNKKHQRWYIIDGVPTCTAFRDRAEKARTRRAKKDPNQRTLFSEEAP